MKLHEGYFEMDVVVWNRGHVTRTTPEPTYSSPNFGTKPAERCFTFDEFNVFQTQMHEIGSRATTFRSRIRDSVPRPSQPYFILLSPRVQFDGHWDLFTKKLRSIQRP
ncbi:hypothetical protein AVEN_39914-1 [Araneus ventricosus]|uniref:Uncharacterized protein n=1 Tax=Araneus ventricosus TaxID=182803 RepID=A0A4Y2A8S0_ARAVE|nr:hypothetical protein AVEN_39914-1 [Araneus ventricosus]